MQKALDIRLEFVGLRCTCGVLSHLRIRFGQRFPLRAILRSISAMRPPTYRRRIGSFKLVAGQKKPVEAELHTGCICFAPLGRWPGPCRLPRGAGGLTKSRKPSEPGLRGNICNIAPHYGAHSAESRQNYGFYVGLDLLNSGS